MIFAWQTLRADHVEAVGSFFKVQMDITSAAFPTDSELIRDRKV